MPSPQEKDTKKRAKIVVVVGLPINDAGQFLLTQRHAPHATKLHNRWQLAGGAIEFGETPEQALKREFQEELGVKITILEDRPFAITNVWPAEPGGHRIETHALVLSYLVRLAPQHHNQTSFTTDEETGDARWFTAQEIMSLDTFPNVQKVVNAALKLL